MELGKIPTGIESLDSLIMGGIPSGSFVMLVGEVGAGNVEFAYTSAVKLVNLKNDPILHASVKEQIERDGVEYLVVPEKICYISFTRSKNDVLKEIARSFPPQFARVFRDNMFFKDFSSLYYSGSVAPASWLSNAEKIDLSVLKGGGSKKLLEELISFLDANAPHNLVIIDSITNLVRACSDTVEWFDLVSFLSMLQRVSKRWDCLIYGLMTANIFEPSKETEILDCGDGIMVFDWYIKSTFQRQQTMYVKKFRGLMPHMAKDNLATFETNVTSLDGFNVTNVKRISGKR